MNKTKILAKDALADITAENVEDRLSEMLAFTELYRRNATPVFYYLFSRVRNEADAQDLTSQTFLTAIENLSSLHNRGKFTAWVFAIARNKASDYFRKSQRHPTMDYDEKLQVSEPGAEEISRTDRERLSELESLISRLSQPEQEILRLRIAADLPFAEIASILNEPESRIKKKYYRLLERLQAQVER